jgi:hypothetical protein
VGALGDSQVSRGRELRALLRRAGFIAAVIALAWALSGPLDFAARPYGGALRAVSNAVVQPFGGKFETRIRSHAAKSPRQRAEGDTDLVFRLRDGRRLGVKVVDTKALGYDPTVLFLSLVLLTFIPRKRKLVAAAWGLLLLHAFVALRLLARVLLGWVVVGKQPAVELGSWLEAPWLDSALTLALRIDMEAFLHLILPVALWAALCFRPADWERWFWSGRRGSAPPAGPPAGGEPQRE